jgi:hypothetical protein
MDASKTREILVRFVAQEINVDQLATIAPECICETAEALDGGHGPVGNDERLRLFLVSRSDIDLKASEEKLVALIAARPFKAMSLAKAYKTGLSVCRLDHADRDELNYTAELLHSNQTANNSDYGGLVAVVDFPVRVVRSAPKGGVPMCVLDTPLEPVGSAYFKRPSHADVVCASSGLSEEDRLSARSILYNSIQSECTKTNVENLLDADLAQFLPAVIVRRNLK